jgi:asparagine synthase (glutamine-hydrolysing)
MAVGIEMRIPFLSKKIVEFANSLPFKDKYNKKSGTTKVLLRLMAKDLLPDNILNKPKLSFELDMKDWIREDKIKILFKNMINDKKSFFSGYLDEKIAREIFDLHFSGKRKLDTVVWNMFTLETWHRVCGEGDNTF